MSGDDTTIAELIARKRAAGYDAEFEALMARQWLCNKCGHQTTISHVLIPVGDPDKDLTCPACLCDDIHPRDDEPPNLTVVTGGKEPT